LIQNKSEIYSKAIPMEVHAPIPLFFSFFVWVNTIGFVSSPKATTFEMISQF